MEKTGQRRSGDERGPGRGKKDVPQGNVFSKPTLDDLKVTRKESHRWQRVASIPEERFESALTTARDGGKEITTAGRPTGRAGKKNNVLQRHNASPGVAKT